MGVYSYRFFNSQGCSKKGCFCREDSQEIPCNSCGIAKPILITGIFNVVKMCSGTEVILCQNSNKVGVRYDVEQSTCKNKFFFFIIPIY